MTATYTFDVFSSLDGFGAATGDWTGYWGKQGPELLEHRLAVPPCTSLSTGRTGHWSEATQSTSWRGSRKSPTCRCGHTAACR